MSANPYPKHRQPWSNEELARLKEVCRFGRPDWNKISQEFGRKPYPCRKKAIDMEYVPVIRVAKFWQPEQEQALFELCETGLYTWPEIEHRLTVISQKNGWPIRSRHSVFQRLNRAGYSVDRCNLSEFLTIPAITTGLGLASDWAVRSWVKSGRLAAKEDSGSAARDPYRIRLTDFVRFALENPSTVAGPASADGVTWLLLLIREIACLKQFSKRA